MVYVFNNVVCATMLIQQQESVFHHYYVNRFLELIVQTNVRILAKMVNLQIEMFIGVTHVLKHVLHVHHFQFAYLVLVHLFIIITTVLVIAIW